MFACSIWVDTALLFLYGLIYLCCQRVFRDTSNGYEKAKVQASVHFPGPASPISITTVAVMHFLYVIRTIENKQPKKKLYNFFFS